MSDPTSIPRGMPGSLRQRAGGAGDEDRYELGVLFVHGLGQQKRGETLVQLGNSLVSWLRRWIGGEAEGPSTSVGGSSPEELRTDAVAEVCGVEVAEARLIEDPADPERPATAEVEVRLPRDVGFVARDRWLLAESHWAEEFLPPDFLNLCRWGLAVVPWTIATHLGQRLRRLGKKMAARERPAGLPADVLDVLRGLVLLVMVPIGATLGMAVVLVLLLFALVPIPAVRRWLGGVQRTLAGTLGDSLVLLENPVQAAAIVGRVARDLRWLTARCRKVAVVAHSQGAAVACEALARGDLAGRRPEDHLLLTFGSGLGKLEDLRRFRRERAPWSGVFAPLGLLFWVIALFSLGWIGSGGLIDPDFGDAAFTLFLGLLSFLVAVGVVTGIQPDREKLAPEARFGIALRWCDHWTSSDPVPNGPLFDPGKAPEYLNSREEANHGSFFRDHTAYHRNVEGFAASLAAELARLRGLHLVLRPGDGARLRLGRQRRRFRVRCSVLARRVALVALVAVPWALGAVGRLRPIGRGLCDRLGALAARSPEWIAGLIEPLLDLDAAVHGIAVTWAGVGLAYAPVAVAWHAWSWWDVQDYFRRREYRIGAWPWVWAILAAAFASVLLALASLPFMPQVAAEGESMTLPWIYPMATVLLAFGVELVRGLVGCLVRCVFTLSRWRAIFAGKLVPRVVLAFVGNLFDVYLGACGRALWIGPLTFLWTYPPVVVLWRWLGGAGEEREPWIVGGSLAIALLGVVVTILAERRLYRRVETLAAVGDPARALKEETRSLLEVLRPPDPPGSAEPAG